MRYLAREAADEWLVRVPASSANLGAGFDALAVALDVSLELSPNGEPAPESHPAVKAFRAAGGTGSISVRARFPGGRGLGFSGAARVGGLVAAAAQRGASGDSYDRDAVLPVASEMEGHADNVAASLAGGVVAVGGGRMVRIPLGCALAVVLWIPDRETATDNARRTLPGEVPLADAAFNVGRTALLVAALATGDVDVLRTATEDRLHQDHRLARVPATRAAIDAALANGAYAAWLSGSGPSAAAFAAPEHAPAVAAALPAGGRSLVLDIAPEGAAIILGGGS